MSHDLRDWINQVDGIGELLEIGNADCDLEIGGLTDIYQSQHELPCLLFDNIPGYPKGYRVLTNLLNSQKRLSLTLGLPLDSTRDDIIAAWRQRTREWKLTPPQNVTAGPIMENVKFGDEVDLWAFPSPKWHELDGGRYIGTGCMVIMEDPEGKWVNFGAYRVQVIGKDKAAIMISKGKQGDIILQKYLQNGEPCPVVVCAGQDPLLFVASGLEMPYGVSEYDVVGGLSGSPVETIPGPKTGLPIPAAAEIAFEGYIHPGEMAPEGPFGEWTGYYVSGQREQPVINVVSVLHRNNPIMVGSLPRRPPSEDSFYRGFLRSALIWNQLEQAGLSGIKGVWTHEAGTARLWVTVAVKQLYAGHARQVGLVATGCQAGAYANRFVVVVDDDVDPFDTDEVLWALCTRFDPRKDITHIDRAWGTELDPMSYSEEGSRRVFNSRMILDACRPWELHDEFPQVAECSPELKQRIMQKWPELFPGG